MKTTIQLSIVFVALLIFFLVVFMASYGIIDKVTGTIMTAIVSAIILITINDCEL